MIYEWNAYRIFLNGKRAKRPSITFKHDNEKTVSEHFESKIKRRLGKKYKSSEFTILRADLPQNSKEEIELAWEWCDNAYKIWQKSLQPLYSYPAGSNGPNESKALLQQNGHNWHDE